MKNNKKYLIPGVALFILSQTALVSAGLKDFKQDFAKKNIEIADNRNAQPQDEDKKAQEETNKPSQNTQVINLPQVTVAQTTSNNGLGKFRDDFKTNKKDEPANNSRPSPANQNTYNYPPDYYRYNYPYYYPYQNFYPGEAIIIQGDEYDGGLPGRQSQQIKYAGLERHTWYNASLDYRSVSKDLTSVGMILSIISAGKITEISYGFKFDYNLYTEKDGEGHYSLPMYNLGLVLGKQMWKGLVESYISYAKLGDFSGLSLKLSSEQWVYKYAFLTGGLGVSIINDSPLTDTEAGIGFGNSMIQFVIGYRAPTSVNYSLNGPEFKIRVIL